MKRYKMSAETRASKGHQVRREKKVPAVLYGRETETTSLAIPESEVNQFIQYGSANALIDLQIGSEARTVMLKDLQRNKLKEQILHLDLYEVNLKEKLITNVPVHLVGEPEGFKEGGVVQNQTREVEVRCLPTAIPQGFDLDISALNIGDALSVVDLDLPEEVELLTPENEIIVSIVAPRMVDEGEETDEEEADVEEVEDQEGDAE